MKNLWSFVLAFAVAAALFFPIKNNFIAGKATVQPNTYIPRNMLWYNSKGAVYVKDIKEDNQRALFYKAKGKDEVRLTGFSFYDDSEFYIRGDVVYFTLSNTLYSVKTNGKSLKALAYGVRLVGGYGSRVIFYYVNDPSSGYYALYSSGKIKSLWKQNIEKTDADRTLFNGKIYSANKIFDISKKKTTTVNSQKAYYDMCSANKNYLYYVGESATDYSLRRVGKSGGEKNYTK